QVHRVPDDGDCFFSSIKVAIEGGSHSEEQWCTGVGEPRTNTTNDGQVVVGSTVPYTQSVKEMREWVADAAGEEQLSFYCLQAEANPTEKWQ
ncbi:unnamed protein product, partial [Choristocarpus tenellus]